MNTPIIQVNMLCLWLPKFITDNKLLIKPQVTTQFLEGHSHTEFSFNDN